MLSLIITLREIAILINTINLMVICDQRERVRA